MVAVKDIDTLLSIDDATISMAEQLVDSGIQQPVGLWNPGRDDEAEGGVNYGGDDPGEGADIAEG